MFMIDLRDTEWWYWAATACCLTAGIAGHPAGFQLAIALTVVQLVHIAVRDRSLKSFPVQSRLGYLALLLFALPEALQALYWVPFVGTWARVLFGYCAMARMVSLLPWNRREPLSARMVFRTFLSRPVRGSILQGLPAADPGRA